jgi:cation-transporting P-type ATPase C
VVGRDRADGHQRRHPGRDALPVNANLGRLLTLANVSPVLIEGADTLLRQGIKMEVLDALVVGLATLKGEAYTANITAFLLALGEYLEHQTQRKSDQLAAPAAAAPNPRPPGWSGTENWSRCPATRYKVGEIVVVGVGETVPVDGRVVEGTALVNQAAVTGEDLPVRREQRQRVVAGSVVEEGRIRIEAQRVGSETTTARVASFIQSSLENRSDTQRYGR